ncbi:MAG: OsmC family protein [Candidatus Lokiarchaeota archaeon]|nr:OsmC family protein [Candidatus Lokiarchaeota archaeon]
MATKDEGSTVAIGIAWEKDLTFKVSFEGLDVPSLRVDETNKIEADMIGVTPARLLASAVGSCLASSLMFCMSKRNVQLDTFTARAQARTGRDPDGRLRVQEISVDLLPRTTDPAAIKRLAECKKVFEKFCTVTESVRKGIKVVVNVVDE